MPSMPARVTFQPLGRGWFLNNYHNEAVDVALLLARPAALRDGFTRDRLGAPASRHALSIPARGRLWINAD